MKQFEFKLAKDTRGNELFTDFLMSLPAKDRQKLLTLISNIEEVGIPRAIKMKWVKKLNNNLYEIRSKLGSNIQRAFYFHVINDEYIITHGFTKKTQKTPKGEMEKAERIRKYYLKGVNKDE